MRKLTNLECHKTRTTISENIGANKKIWVDGGTHAREWITPATVTFIIKRLMANWGTQPDYMRNKTWLFMPVVNPDGYMYSRQTDRLWRKNRATNKGSNCRGVDINRNFNIGWNTGGSSTNPCHDTYRGTSANSERETRAIVAFLKERQLQLEGFLTFHSYGQALVYPYAYKAAKSKYAGTLQRVGNKAAKLIKGKTGRYYKVGVTHRILSQSGGGTDDWTSSVLGTKYVYTVELRDRGRFGFLLPAKQIRGAALEGYIMVDTMAQDIS